MAFPLLRPPFFSNCQCPSGTCRCLFLYRHLYPAIPSYTSIAIIPSPHFSDEPGILRRRLELVRQIAFNADHGSQGSVSLLALACSCQTTEGPVMDVLWQRQESLHIILRTLPAGCWTVTGKVYVSGAPFDLPDRSLSPPSARS